MTTLDLPGRTAPDPSDPLRVAMLSVHTSPLDQPGTGDAGGMNVYVTELAHALARRGTQVEIFTRATASSQPPVVEVSDGVTVRHVAAGPFEGLDKNDLPGQLSASSAGGLPGALPRGADRHTDSPALGAGLTFALTLPWLLFALPAGALSPRG